MAINATAHQVETWAKFYDPAVKQVALEEYKLMPLFSQQSIAAKDIHYFQQNTSNLAGVTVQTGKDIPPGADFPEDQVKFKEQIATIKKYGLKSTLAWDTIITNNIDVRNRTAVKLGKGVAKFVDDNQAAAIIKTGTQSFTSSAGWVGSSADIFGDVMRAIELQQKSPNNYMGPKALILTPGAYRFLAKWIVDNGAQFNQQAGASMQSGQVRTFAGISNIIVTNSFATSHAAVVEPKVFATWYELEPLRTITSLDEGVSLMIRSWQQGVVGRTDPNAVTIISGIGI